MNTSIKKEPSLYILAGPNGAGKTTASRRVLPDLKCDIFLNADEIAAANCPSNPESFAVEAGRIMLSKIKHHLNNGDSFAIETTLATRSYARLVDDAKQRGYIVVLLFFWLDSPEIAFWRVQKRVSEGGHNIPPEVIERRYWLGLQNLFQLFMSRVSEWAVFDNNADSTLIANSSGIADYNAYNNIIGRIPIDHQIQVLDLVKTGESKTNWDLITHSLMRNYEALMIEKEKKSQPVIISMKGKPRQVSASEILKNLQFYHKLNPKTSPKNFKNLNP